MDNGQYYTDCKTKLGRGSFGAVFKGHDRLTDQPVAMKQIQKTHVFLNESAEKELISLQKLQHHDNVVQYLDSFADANNFWVIIEFCDRGDLDSYLRKCNPNLDRKVQIMTECASAISFMHNLNPAVIHRDIKLNNILLKSITNENEVIVKICDFGVAKIFEEEDEDEMMKTDTGTMPFRAPEFNNKVHGKLRYDKSVDTFALGLVYQVMINYGVETKETIPHAVSHRLDYATIGMSMLSAKVLNKQFPVLFTMRPGEVSPLPELKALVSQMTAFEPEDRFPMSKVLSVLEKLRKPYSTVLDFVEEIADDVQPEAAASTNTVIPVSSSKQTKLPDGSNIKVIIDPMDAIDKDLPRSLLLIGTETLHDYIIKQHSIHKDNVHISHSNIGNVPPSISQAFATFLFYLLLHMVQIIQFANGQIKKVTGSQDQRMVWRWSCVAVAVMIIMCSLIVVKSAAFIGLLLMKYVLELSVMGLYLCIIGGGLFACVLYE